MKVALFSSTIDVLNGYGNITYELCRQLECNNVDCTLFLPASEAKRVASLDVGIDVRCVLPENIFRLYQREGWKFLRSVDVSQYDIVHSLFAFPYCLPALRSAKKYGKPFMMGAQGTYGVKPLTQWPESVLLKKCYKHAKAIVTPSEFTKQQICTYAKADYKIDVIHNGVDTKRFSKKVSTDHIQERCAHKKILLTVGGLKARKGQDLVLKAMQHITQKRDDIVYVLIGDGNWKPKLEQMAEELGVAEHALFAGSKSGDDLLAWFQACDIYVHTPKVVDLMFEGFGIVYLEASMCSKPIVAADAGGIRDAILENETGIITPSGDTEAIARAVLGLLDDPVRMQQLGQAGKDYALKHDWSLIAKQYHEIYHRIRE